MAMPYLSQVSITLSSRILPPAWAIYSTPLLWARSMLSPMGRRRHCLQIHLCSGQSMLSFLTGQCLWLLAEEVLPYTILQHVFPFIADIYVDGVVAVGTADSLFERKIHHLGTLTQPPFVCLGTSQTCAVDAALLTSTDTDGLTIFHIAYRVALCVFQRDERDDEVALCLCCECLVLVGMSSNKAGSSSFTSLRPCSKVMPNTCLCSIGVGTKSGLS